MLVLHNLFFEETFLVPKQKRIKHRKLNPKTNRMKNFKKLDYLKTQIPPHKRTLKNKPDGVRFQDWLGIIGEKRTPTSTVNSFGKSKYTGEYFGWSHRAVAGFKVGDTVKPDTCGNIKPGKEWIIKTEDEARQQAIAFAKEVS